MAVCKLCGQTIREDVLVDERINREDPSVAGPLEKFIQDMGLDAKKQKMLFSLIKPYSAWAVKEALKTWEKKNLYQAPLEHPLKYFAGICRRLHEKHLQDATVRESLPPEFADTPKEGGDDDEAYFEPI